jgi:phosphatidylserine decarboxylase
MRLRDALKLLLHKLLPAHALSSVMHRLAFSETPWIRRRLIDTVRTRFCVDLSEALEENPERYRTFNAFFTRALKPAARPLDPDPATLLSPADGVISQCGPIHGDRVFQAKGRDYSLRALLGGDAAVADQFADGWFATIYLSPRDYHRLHMPISGALRSTTLIPGRLFSVQAFTVDRIDALFARNERLSAVFASDAGWPFAQVLVAAVNVSGIETVWGGKHTPPYAKRIAVTDHTNDGIALQRGAEMGRFNFGSTVILVLPRGVVASSQLKAGDAVRMGQRIATLHV